MVLSEHLHYIFNLRGVSVEEEFSPVVVFIDQIEQLCQEK